MADLFTRPTFEFPYTYKFPGQASDERILYLTRENKVVLWWRIGMTVAASLALAIVGTLLVNSVSPMIGTGAASTLIFVFWFLALAFILVGSWWSHALWQKSIAFITTKRLIKFIYTTPFNRHVLALPLDMIVDTGAYTKGFIQALFRLETFTARSSAASSGVATDDEGGERINKKYFYIENIAFAEDLQHYLSKLLDAIKHHRHRLDTFRPFIPHLKGETRKKFMEQYPEYWS
ncbi:MAG TPA: hypothetical protein VF209_01725 [Patescibacteria group bacterium]